MTIGERIKSARKAAGLTQKQFADLLGVTDSTIRGYEAGRTNLKPSTLRKIAEALGVQPNELISGSDLEFVFLKEKTMTEAQEQKAVFDWARQPSIRAAYPELKMMHAIPNGGKRDPIEAKHLKQQGVKPGVSDISLPVARDRFHGMYIEMKTAKGRLSQAQKDWMDDIQRQGYYATVCRGWKEATDTLQWYLSLGPFQGEAHHDRISF